MLFIMQYSVNKGNTMEETRLTTEMSAELLKKFKAACYSDGSTMKDIIVKFVTQYIDFINNSKTKEEA